MKKSYEDHEVIGRVHQELSSIAESTSVRDDMWLRIMNASSAAGTGTTARRSRRFAPAMAIAGVTAVAVVGLSVFALSPDDGGGSRRVAAQAAVEGPPKVAKVNWLPDGFSEGGWGRKYKCAEYEVDASGRVCTGAWSGSADQGFWAQLSDPEPALPPGRAPQPELVLDVTTSKADDTSAPVNTVAGANPTQRTLEVNGRRATLTESSMVSNPTVPSGPRDFFRPDLFRTLEQEIDGYRVTVGARAAEVDAATLERIGASITLTNAGAEEVTFVLNGPAPSDVKASEPLTWTVDARLDANLKREGGSEQLRPGGWTTVGDPTNLAEKPVFGLAPAKATAVKVIGFSSTTDALLGTGVDPILGRLFAARAVPGAGAMKVVAVVDGREVPLDSYGAAGLRRMPEQYPEYTITRNGTTARGQQWSVSAASVDNGDGPKWVCSEVSVDGKVTQPRDCGQVDSMNQPVFGLASGPIVAGWSDPFIAEIKSTSSTGEVKAAELVDVPEVGLKFWILDLPDGGAGGSVTLQVINSDGSTRYNLVVPVVA